MKTDERKYNYRKAPSLQHKIRVIAGNKTNPVQFGISVPQFIADRFLGCLLRIYASGTMIILESGARIFPEEIKNGKRFCFDGMREVNEAGGNIKWVR